MLLTISTTHTPATDLGFLLHKSPAKFQTFTLSFGQAHVFYPHVAPDLCTAALLVEVDSIQLVRGKDGARGDDFSLRQYVNDRPYAASSFLSVAIAQVFGSALSGRSSARPELADTNLHLSTHIAAVPSRTGKDMIERLFAPLGYEVQTAAALLDPQFPDWGESPYFSVDLTGTVRLRDLLSHLYVLIPVLDDDKHYWVGPDEIEKLLRHGGEWLATHPERPSIAHRYLARQQTYAREALSRLSEDHDEDMVEERQASAIPTAEERVNLHSERHAAVLAALRGTGARSVVDLGCGEGRLIGALLQDQQFERIVGLDVSHRALEHATERLHLDTMPERQRERVTLLHGSLTYRDQRISGFDAATVVEVIEHLDSGRLAAFERVLFEFARPSAVILTTPNVEYNVTWDTLPAGTFRHRDHRFEWNRAEFKTWAESMCLRFGYTVRFLPIGTDHPVFGPPTQMAVFTR